MTEPAIERRVARLEALPPRVDGLREDVTAIADTLLEVRTIVDGHTGSLAQLKTTVDEHTATLAEHTEMLTEILRRLPPAA